MPDLVCYSNNLSGLITEARAAGLDRWVAEDDNGEWVLAGDKTPLIGTDPEYLSLLRVQDTDVLGSLQHIQALGYYDGDDFVPMSPEAQAIYDRLYQPETTTVDTALAGEVTVLARPKIGGFYD